MFLNILLSIIVSATIDSTTLWIGDQTTLHLSATLDKDESVEFPVYGDVLTNGIEIVGQTKRDTLKQKDGRIQISEDLTLTSFQDSLFLIPPQAFVTGEETIYTNPLSLNVIQPFEIDSADMAITDIKDVYRAPIWWWGILRWCLLALLIAAIGVGIYFLVRYLRRRKAQAAGETIEPELLRPAEEVALEKLDQIKAEKVWQKGEVKQYHTSVTDVIREYITRRFDIATLEKTTDEILRDMQPVLRQTEQENLYQELKKMLMLSDLVKFAKWKPLPDENETSLIYAYRFVNDTTPAQTAEQTSDTNNQQ